MGAPLVKTPLTSTWSGADTGNVSPVSIAVTMGLRVVTTAETSTMSPNTCLSAASVCPTGIVSIFAPLARSSNISVGLRVRNSAAPECSPASRYQGRRQHLADKAVEDQISQVLDLRRETRLGSHHAKDASCLGQRSHLAGFRQSISERPFAIEHVCPLRSRPSRFRNVGVPSPRQ